MSNKKPRKPYSALTRICRKIIAVLLLLGIPLIIAASSFHIKNITVIGATRYTSDEIKGTLITSALDHNSLYLYLKYHYFTDISIPFVEKYDLELVDNHTVNIYVYEKRIAGCVKFLGEYLYFDKDGIVVESASRRLEDIPEIKGLNYDKIILNEKLEVQKKELFDVIMNITKLIDKYELNVKSVSFSSDYEVTLSCEDIKILLGKKDTYDEAIAELKGILEAAQGMNLDKIDMRNFVKGTQAIIAKPKQ